MNNVDIAMVAIKRSEYEGLCAFAKILQEKGLTVAFFHKKNIGFIPEDSRNSFFLHFEIEESKTLAETAKIFIANDGLSSFLPRFFTAKIIAFNHAFDVSEDLSNSLKRYYSQFAGLVDYYFIARMKNKRCVSLDIENDFNELYPQNFVKISIIQGIAITSQ
ncbi:hypothetical protein [Desulfovibrio sp. UCD-KL4C]|uniref:hypothetical protein n=1 Tax=Desulfovibrio sp. UCD-KL4C TaxID=2578120 RepID=UPI0025B7D374|nr:hypothetical protein [Desulfovibrio sp. UCD-KL4C]